MKEITIKMHLAFAEEDDLPDERGEPSQRVVDEASKKLRIWLHNQGIEGDLSIIVEDDDRHVALLKENREKKAKEICDLLLANTLITKKRYNAAYVVVLNSLKDCDCR